MMYRKKTEGEGGERKIEDEKEEEQYQEKDCSRIIIEPQISIFTHWSLNH